MKLDKAIAEVQAVEADLARELRRIGERHAVEHDLYHMSHMLAKQCADHIEKLARFAGRYGAPEGASGVDESPGLIERLRHKSSELVGRSEMSGLLLLQDLRNLYLTSQEAEIAWVILRQAAEAARDKELLGLASVSQEEAAGRGKWLRTRIKEAAPQVLVAG